MRMGPFFILDFLEYFKSQTLKIHLYGGFFWFFNMADHDHELPWQGDIKKDAIFIVVRRGYWKLNRIAKGVGFIP